MRTEWKADNIWLRREFVMPPLSAGRHSMAIRVHHDEDAVIYLNGIEAARMQGWTSGYLDLPVPPEAGAALRPGRNVIAIHCHQTTSGQYIDAGLVEYVKP